jgi:hypothetical protein
MDNASPKWHLWRNPDVQPARALPFAGVLATARRAVTNRETSTMKRLSTLCILLLAVVTTSAVAQGRGEQKQQQHHANGGHIPPPPPQRAQGRRAEVETFPGGKVDARPHVSNDHWYGHDDANDRRFALARPFANGRFARVGPSFEYSVARFDLGRHRLWINGGFGFEVADWDWPFASGWCWTCSNVIVVYDDPDHAGWYLLYNTETGVYVHAQYLGG